MRVLITGASGFVGRHLAPDLARQGVEVLRLGRGQAGEGGLAGPADLCDIGAWDGWPSKLDAVVHLAALNPARGEAGWGDEAALMRANADGTAALAKRTTREGVPRLVFLSTAKVHGGARLGIVTEASPLAPPDAYARSKLEGEERLREAVAGSGTAAFVLRPAPVFGPGGRGLVSTLGRLARLPVPLPLGGLGAPRSLVSVESLVSAIRAALGAPLAAGEAPAVLVADRGPLDPAGIVGALRAGLGRRAGILPAPFATLAARRLAGGVLGRFVADPGEAAARLGWEPAPRVSAELEAFARRAPRG
jgi:nucleoside-diphosphate-sugar epimerase